MVNRLITIGCLLWLTACGLLDGNDSSDDQAAKTPVSTGSLYENQVNVFQQDRLLMSDQSTLVLELPEDMDIRTTD